MYKPTNYLIGPELYPTYRKILQGVLTYVPGIIGVIVLTVNLIEQQEIFTSIIAAIGTVLAVGLQVTFWVTLVFACLERFASIDDLVDKHQLVAKSSDQPVKAKRHIGRIEGTFSVIFSLIGIVFVALSPQIHIVDNHTLFNPTLWSFWVPLFFVLAGVSLIHEVFQLKVGYWTTALMVTHVLVNSSMIIFILTLITTQSVINPALLAAIQLHNPDQAITELVRWPAGISVAVVVVSMLWDIGQSIMLNRRLAKHVK